MKQISLYKSYSEKKWYLSIVLLGYLFAPTLQAQDFMMQGWYWDFPKTCDGNNWANTLQGHANDLGNAGFTMMWHPPFTRAGSGTCSNGYDPSDIYDLGEFGQGATHYGTRADVDAAIAAFNNAGIISVADVVYNHRDAGDWEVNPAAADYVFNYPNNSNCGNGITPYPINGKLRYILPIGGATGLGVGDYYFKFRSPNNITGFGGTQYKVYAQTQTIGFLNQPAQNEVEPNGGLDCGEGSQLLALGIDMLATQEGAGCLIDEWQISLTATDFNAAGDQIEIYVSEINGGGMNMDICPIQVFYNGNNIHNNLQVQTKTDFSTMPSGQGAMNYTNFQPASSPNTGTYATCLEGDYDFPFFFFDIESDNPTTQTAYNDWSKWLWNDVGIRGYRMDAVKHFNPAFVSNLLNDLHNNGMNPPMVVGEIFDSNLGALSAWVDAVNSGLTASANSAINVRVFDFALREKLKQVCEGFLQDGCSSNNIDARDIFTSGLVDGGGKTGFDVVTFANNHDFRGAGEPISQKVDLAYAYLLTNNQIGLPSIFYADYYNDTPANYPVTFLQNEINDLIALHKTYITGANQRFYLNDCNAPAATYNSGFAHASLIYQLRGGIGGKDVVVAINFASDALDVNINLETTGLSNGQEFTDVLGTSNGNNSIFLAGNQLNLKVPGNSYAVWVQGQLILPVELVTFAGKVIKNDAQLEWTTQSEQNNKGFYLQKSLDGQKFTDLAFIEGKGDYSGRSDYEYKDVFFEESAYYRLKQVDLDGSERLSQVVFLEKKKTAGGISILPNPFSDKITFNTKPDFEEQQRLRFRLMSVTGKVLFEGERNLRNAEHELNEVLQRQTRGVFFLSIDNGQVLKLIKG